MEISLLFHKYIAVFKNRGLLRCSYACVDCHWEVCLVLQVKGTSWESGIWSIFPFSFLFQYTQHLEGLKQEVKNWFACVTIVSTVSNYSTKELLHEAPQWCSSPKWLYHCDRCVLNGYLHQNLGFQIFWLGTISNTHVRAVIYSLQFREFVMSMETNQPFCVQRLSSILHFWT